MQIPGKKYILNSITALILLFPSLPGFSADYYNWVDEKGNMHITDSLGKVPEEYRDQIRKKRLENDEPSASSPVPASGSDRKLYSTNSGVPMQANKESGEKQPKKIEVAYKPFEGTSKRVIVSATFNGSVTADMAIDTGAPGTVLSSALAKKLGLFDEGHGNLVILMRGINGDAPAVRSIVDMIQVGDAKIDFVPVTIVNKLSDSFEGLLGLDFVANYSVTIDPKRKIVAFEELPSDDEHPGGHDHEWWSSLFKEFAGARSEWKIYSEQLDNKIKASLSPQAESGEEKEFADYQYREAEKLLDKLDCYASRNAVPIHWRK